MSVLEGLRKKIEEFYKNKGKNKNCYVEIKNLADMDEENLTSEEILLFMRGDVSFSDDSNFIIARLNSFLKVLGEKDFSIDHNVLRDFVYDISNWDKQIYVEEKGPYYWHYKTILDDDRKEKRNLIELVCGEKKVMLIEVIMSYGGNLLSFRAKYNTDISDYAIGKGEIVKKSKFGTVLVEIDCPINGDVMFSDFVFNLDLLENCVFSEKQLNDNIISTYQCSLNKDRGRW